MMGAHPYLEDLDWGSDKLFHRPALRRCENCGHEHRAAACKHCGLRYDGRYEQEVPAADRVWPNRVWS